MSRARPGTINQTAVAEVLARHLWAAPRRPGDAEIMPHQLKDTVSRALSARVVTRQTVELFIAAFGFSEEEARRLWQLWNGATASRSFTGLRAVPEEAGQEINRAVGPARHHTVALHDHLQVDEDGRLGRARTLQVIEAIADHLDRIPIMYDTSRVSLETGQGCAGLSGQLRQVRPDVFAAEILLPRPLRVGETHNLEYWVTWLYPGNLDDPHESEYRRAVMRQLENYDMRVEFHPSRLPARLWWAMWDGADGPVIQEEEALLDSQHSASRFLRSAEKTVAGFHWTWPEAEST